MHLFLLPYFVVVLVSFVDAFPVIQLELLQPTGFRLAIPHQSMMSQVSFDVNINKPLNAEEPGTYSLIVHEPYNGRWVLEAKQARLFYGSKLNFRIHVHYGDKIVEKIASAGISNSYLEIVDPSEPPSTTETITLRSDCIESSTTVGGKPTCGGELIFEENFDTIDWVKWSREVGIPLDDAEFVSYQTRPENFYIKSGSLYIVPSLLSDLDGYDEDSIRTGKLDLEDSCTGIRDIPRECSKNAAFLNILPPVVSAKIRTREYFTFRYGKVEVRAKMPKGDWLTPLILLEPVENFYGYLGHASGQIRIAQINGNEFLEYVNGTDISGNVIFGGAVLAVGHQFRKLWMNKSIQRAHLADDYHVYTLIWSEKAIILQIDGTKYAEINGGFAVELRNSMPYAKRWENGHYNAPFDREFFLTLGLSVGGHSDFPDFCRTGLDRKTKPWKNGDPKALSNFWRDREQWHKTWKGDDAGLKIDYVRVYAL